MRKLIAIALLLFAISAGYGQTADQLYRQGYTAYTSYRWKDAMNLLSRYLNYRPQPADLADSSFRAQVTAAYNYARKCYLNPPATRRISSDGGDAGVDGLTQPPPPLRKP